MSAKQHIAPFEALDWQKAAWRSKAPRLLLSGGAGGGKSRLWMEKLHGYALKYPNVTSLMLRKTRSSMTNSAVLAYERRVIGGDSRVVHYPSKFRFEYSNGAIVAYGGMASAKEREAIRSIGADGGLGMVVLEEATAFSYEDYLEVVGRLRDPNAAWRQLVLATNPGSDLHWINQRLIIGGEAEVHTSFARNNPHNPDDYAESLGELERSGGVLADRIVRGLWVRAGGVVYDKWDDAENVREIEYDGEVPIIWAVDDGYAGTIDPVTRSFTANSHPRAILICQQASDGVLHVLDESYEIGTLSDKHIETVIEQFPYPAPLWVAVDSSAAELRGRFNMHGIQAMKGTHTVEEGIKELNRRLAADGNGRRMVLVSPRCEHLRKEFAAYVRDKQGKVVKEFDHGVDALRYLAWVTRWGRV